MANTKLYAALPIDGVLLVGQKHIALVKEWCTPSPCCNLSHVVCAADITNRQDQMTWLPR